MEPILLPTKCKNNSEYVIHDTISNPTRVTDLEYFSTNLPASHALSNIKNSFFDENSDDKVSNNTQKFKDKAVRFIIAIQKNNLNSLIEPVENKSLQQPTTTFQEPIQPETLDQLKIICASLQYRQKLLEWLHRIANATKETIDEINIISPTEYIQYLIKLAESQTENDEDLTKAQINFLKNVLRNITDYNSNISTHRSKLYSEINKQLQALKEKSPHLLLELSILLCNKINELLKSLKTKDARLSSKLNTLLSPYMRYMHNITISDSTPSYVKDEVDQYKNYTLAKNLIYNLYNDNNYGPHCIEMIFEIITVSDNSDYSIQQLANYLPHPESFTVAERKNILFEAKKSTQNIAAEKLLHDHHAESYSTIPQPFSTETSSGTLNVNSNENDLLNSKRLMYNQRTQVTKADKLQTLSQYLSTITSRQRSRLKTWVETSLKNGKPEKTSDIDNICFFFQEHIIIEIVKQGNRLAGNKITKNEIGRLQSAKLRKSGVPETKKNIVQKLTNIFNNPAFQNFLAKILKTIIYVIDSVQYSISINEKDGSSCLNPHHSVILPPESVKKAKDEAYTEVANSGFDRDFYISLKENHEVMTSIRNICQRPEGFSKYFSSLIGNIFGANYPTDEVNEVKNMLSAMTTKEFFGAGYNALKVVSVNPARYLVEDTIFDDEPKDTDVESKVLTDNSDFNSQPPTPNFNSHPPTPSLTGSTSSLAVTNNSLYVCLLNLNNNSTNLTSSSDDNSF